MKRTLIEVVRSTNEREGTTFLIVSHEMPVVAALCEWVFAMHLGPITSTADRRRCFPTSVWSTSTWEERRVVRIRGEDLTVAYYADIHVLLDVTVEARENQITCVIGPNGAGKSTLLKTIFGYPTPRSGRVYLAERDITDLQAQERMKLGVGYVDQLHSVFPEMSVDENLELGAWTFRRDKQRIAEAKERVYQQYPALAARREIHAGLMSGGEQRMLEIAREARAILTRCCLLVDGLQSNPGFIVNLPSPAIDEIHVEHNLVF